MSENGTFEVGQGAPAPAAAAAPITEYNVSVRGTTIPFDHPITIDDLMDLAEEKGIAKFSAYNRDGAKVLNEQFPYAGDLEIRELLAPKMAGERPVFA